MRADELMVGDWVQGYLPDTYSKVCGIFNEKRIAINTINNTYIELSVDDIKPIPITPEILEKNGWFYPSRSMWMKLDNPYRELWGCMHTDGTLWLYSSGDLDKDDAFAEIRYAHELQRALRLCGIERNIVV